MNKSLDDCLTSSSPSQPPPDKTKVKICLSHDGSWAVSVWNKFRDETGTPKDPVSKGDIFVL